MSVLNSGRETPFQSLKYASTGRVYRDSVITRLLPDRFAKPMLASNRITRGQKMIDVLRKELELVVPELEKHGVKLGLENLPYAEGFPNLDEVGSVTGDWVRPWLDTGHWYARENAEAGIGNEELRWKSPNDEYVPVGMHLNDSKGGDDHLAPGDGKIDFAAFKPMMESAEHLVLEPNSSVTEEQLRAALAKLRSL